MPYALGERKEVASQRAAHGSTLSPQWHREDNVKNRQKAIDAHHHQSGHPFDITRNPV